METKTTDLQKMPAFETLSAKVLAAMAPFGWAGGRGSLAAKTFKTIQVGQTAVAYLYQDDGYHNPLKFQFTSEGRNVLNRNGTDSRGCQ